MAVFSRAITYTLVHIIGSITFGFITIFPTPGLRGMRKEFPNFDSLTNPRLVRYFNSFTSLFGTVGGFLVHFLIRYVFNNQRRIVICLINLLGVAIWLLHLIITPERLWVGILLRSIQGIVSGANSTLTPIMIMEIAPTFSKGLFGGLAQIGKTTGFLIFYFVSYFGGWKMMCIVGAIFCLIHSTFIWLTPKNDEINGIYILENENEEFQKEKGKCMCLTFSTKGESIFQRKYASSLFCVIAMMIFQQFCGINVINANMSKIMTNCGLNIDTDLKSAISTSAQWLGVFVSSFILDACGRKYPWIFSTAGVAISLGLYSMSLKMEFKGWYPALCVFLIMLFFGIGMGPIPWFIGYELFPYNIRMIAQSIVNCASCLATFAVIFVNPIITEKIGDFYAVIIFMSITFVSTFFGICCVKDPDDIEEANTIL